jgi:hypothetical protein
LETEKGTTLAFKVPDLDEMILDDGTVIPAQSNLQIIGATSMVDTIIIFTTNETSTSPNGYGQIWMMKYSEEEDAIIGLTGANELDLSHLVYNQKLDFSTEHRIGRAIALYETITKQRVYWTDYYNQVRVFNLVEANSLNVPVGTIDLFPSPNLVHPVVESIGTGGLPAGTQIQFSYKLLNNSGGETLYAPPTPMFPLSEDPTLPDNFTTFDAGKSINNLSKSVTYSLTGLDTSFDTIQHVAILHNINGITVYEYSEESIPSTGNLEVLCSSVADAIQIPLEVYSMLSSGFDRAKDIEVQGNRLIAANIFTGTFEADFDARAYRFNHTNTGDVVARLEDSNDPLLNSIELIGGGATPLYDTVPEEHDAINVYNREQELDWYSQDRQYKYQADGVTLGGSGKNISYKFTLEGLRGNTNASNPTSNPNHITVSGYPVGTSPLYFGGLEADGSPTPVHIANQITNHASPWAHANLKGYARGETYRFGIVFYNKRGSTSFVEWIGDIRFPDVWENDFGVSGDGFPMQLQDGENTNLYNLGIEFTIDVSSIAGDISGYSIVRLDRTTQDSTKLGTGFFMFFDKQESGTTNSLFHRFAQTGAPQTSGTNPNDPFNVSNEVNINGSDTFGIHLADRPGFTNWTYPDEVVVSDGTQIANAFTQRYGYLISPLGKMYIPTFKEGDYIDTLAYYKSDLANYVYNDITAYPGYPDPYSENKSAFGFYYKLQDRVANPPNRRERYEIRNTKVFQIGHWLTSGGDFFSGLPGNALPFHNASYCRASGSPKNIPFGMGNKKLGLNLLLGGGGGGVPPAVPSIPHSTVNTNLGGTSPSYAGGAGWGMYWVTGISDQTSWMGPDVTGTTLDFQGGQLASDRPYFKSVGYRRYLPQQYGGNSYEDRSTNQYIYTGHYQITRGVPGNAADVLTTRLFGGDVYVNYYDEEYIEQYWDSGQNYNDAADTQGINKLSIAVMGPVETPINTNWRQDRHWAKDRLENDMGSYPSNSNSIAQAYIDEDLSQSKFFAKDFLSDFVEEHPHLIWASEIKTNGELVDSWRNFPIANTTEVDGIYGPINRIISFHDKLMFYQDRAYGWVSLDERSLVQDQSGAELVLGVGGVFPSYEYYSTTSGSLHQFGVVASDNAVYHYDARTKKFMAHTGGGTPLSDIKGLSSFFANEVLGAIKETDKTTRFTNPTGVHGVRDNRHNRILFTFLNHKPSPSIDEFQNEDGSWTIPSNTFFDLGNGDTYFSVSNVSIPASTEFVDFASFKGFHKAPASFTVSYNELSQSFESFYDYRPTMYLEYGRRLMSVSPFARNEMHTHNSGPEGKYYDLINSVSRLNTVLAGNGDVTKVFNNLAYDAELYDSTGADIYNETFDRVRFYNNYQDTGMQDLTLNTNVKRRMRTWRMTIPRDADSSLARLRNPWIHCILEYDNTGDKRHVLHDLIYSFTPARL